MLGFTATDELGKIRRGVLNVIGLRATFLSIQTRGQMIRRELMNVGGVSAIILSMHTRREIIRGRLKIVGAEVVSARYCYGQSWAPS